MAIKLQYFPRQIAHISHTTSAVCVCVCMCLHGFWTLLNLIFMIKQIKIKLNKTKCSMTLMSLLCLSLSNVLFMYVRILRHWTKKKKLYTSFITTNGASFEVGHIFITTRLGWKRKSTGKKSMRKLHFEAHEQVRLKTNSTKGISIQIQTLNSRNVNEAEKKTRNERCLKIKTETITLVLGFLLLQSLRA